MSTPPELMAFSFVLTGGGTGGHIFPALAVARVLKNRGHRLLFIGTKEKIESQVVPAAGYDIRFIRTGALNRVSIGTRLRSACKVPMGVIDARKFLREFRPDAIFSTGGYVAGPVMLAGILARVPVVVMEPNATAGFANRAIGRFAYRALLGFESSRRWFPPSRAEVTGLPVRSEFFTVPRKESGPFTALITGGSLGSRTLNRASRESWSLFRDSGTAIRIVHQTGSREHEALAREFEQAGIDGQIVPFIPDMAAAFAKADVVVARAGAGSINEIAAARMAAVLIPLPFAADDHQRRNAEALAAAGAANMVLDSEMNGQRLFEEIERLRQHPNTLGEMRERVGAFAHPGAAERAADVLEQAARERAVRKR